MQMVEQGLRCIEVWHESPCSIVFDQGWALILLVLSPLCRTSGSSSFLPSFQSEVIAHWKTTHCLS